MVQRCYCIFEGGGAKGIAHVGALSALESASLDLLGFAGTSAGAIVAALAAAGYRSDELFGPTSSILDQLDLDPTNEWGFAAHKPVRTPPRLLGRMAWMGIQTSSFALRVGIWVVLLLLFLSSGIVHWLGWIGEFWEFVIQLTLVLLLIAAPFYIATPLASLKRVANSIDQAVALKLVKRRRATGIPLGPDQIPVGPEGITFADLARAGGKPLKIVATDITRRRLALFSADTTPDVTVGNAVAASICLPGIFRPWRVGENLHYDGGLISNLPAWAFDAERALDRDAWTAVVEIADPPVGKPARWGPRILASTLSTALFGASGLDTRGVDRLRSVALKVELKLLQFGLSREDARRVVTSARDSCRAELIYQILVLPPQIEAMCEVIAKDCRALANVARSNEKPQGGELPLPPLTGRMRAALFFPLRGEAGTLLNEFSYGYDDHPDERMRLRIDSSVAGQAWTQREPLYADRELFRQWKDYYRDPQERWAQKLAWPDVAWGIYVPYYHEPNDLWLVVAVDCDEPLALADPGTTLVSLVDRIETILKQQLPQEAFAWL